MATTEPLTEQEQQALEQMRQAQEQGSTLKELAARLGLRFERRIGAVFHHFAKRLGAKLA